jgi:hypothetical protein
VLLLAVIDPLPVDLGGASARQILNVWFEAIMLEPKITRGAGRTVHNVIVTFEHLNRYTP